MRCFMHDLVNDKLSYTSFFNLSVISFRDSSPTTWRDLTEMVPLLFQSKASKASLKAWISAQVWKAILGGTWT